MPEDRTPGGTVASVGPGAARHAGIRVGDRVLSVNGAPVRDVIDWWWLTADPPLRVTLDRAGVAAEVDILPEAGESLGVTFTDVIFDGIRECENACSFCFVAQLPQGLRPALYVHDDDYRLSFLAGNFVTLTNLTDADVDRIVEQRLAPLHVSVHAVDPAVRARLVCPTVEDRGLERLDELAAAGIALHVQIVLVPDVNDAAVLDETLAWLSERGAVASVGVVPVGYTSHQSRITRSFDAAQAGDVLAQIERWQVRMRAARGVGWVYAADEFYLNAGREIPPAAAYDDFPQFENGIGMVRSFVDDFKPGGEVPPATIVTGELFAPVLRSALDRLGASVVRVLPVANRLFGGNVSVTGLLGGRDLIDAIAVDTGPEPFLVPDVVVNSDGLLLDDLPADELEARSGRAVRIVASDGAALAEALTRPER